MNTEIQFFNSDVFIKVRSMTDEEKTKEQLIEELESLRHINMELEFKLASCGKMDRDSRNAHCKIASLIENLPGMGYACKNDEKWTMEFVSKGSIDLTGYKPEDFINNNIIAFADIIHPDDRQHVWDQVQEALLKKHTYRILYRIRTAWGEVRWVWEHGLGIFSNEGKLLSLQGFIQPMAA
jgi:PAS domain S-box-containing protein